MNGSVALAADPLSVPCGRSCVDGRYCFEAVSTSSRSEPFSEIVLAVITELRGRTCVPWIFIMSLPKHPQQRVRLHLSYLLRVVREIDRSAPEEYRHKLPQVVHHC